jgi:hypothetical protein
VGLNGRVKKLEEKAWGGPQPPCEACGGLIIYEEIAEDGTVTYPRGKPCTVCGSQGNAADGRIGRITVDMRGPEKRCSDNPGPL